MTSTRRFTTLFSLAVAALVFSSALAVEPGASVDLKDTAAVSPCLTVVLIDPNSPVGTEADANCDEIEGAMQASAVLDELVDTAFAASASAAVLYEFEVDAAPGFQGNMVDGMLAYGISWRGVTNTTGAGEYNVSIELAVEDISGAGLPVTVASVLIHEQDSGTGLDEGSNQDMLPLMLMRGNSYRVTASLAVLAATEATTDPASAVADYLSDVDPGPDPAGAWVDVLALQVGFDVAELAAQVEANTAAIEANTEAIADLTEVVELLAGEVADIQQALEDLTFVVVNHTHTYLTGRGQGHNNTLATTTPPDGDEPTPEAMRRGRSRGPKR